MKRRKTKNASLGFGIDKIFSRAETLKMGGVMFRCTYYTKSTSEQRKINYTDICSKL